MRIGCLQFAPKVGDVANNIKRAEAVLSKTDQDELKNLDLLVLPEMAFSGYNFRSREHIAPYLELAEVGPSSQWARTAARKYECTVAVGYPEKVEMTGQEPENYNSLIVVGRDGKTLANYSKSFLYYTDDTWACEGRGFYGGKLGDLGQTAMGICMDINPYKFEAPWDAYEFAFHVLRVRANLVILSTAWLTNDERTSFLARPESPDFYTLTYWANRLDPIIRTGASEETIVVFANRSGVEDEATYAGTSTVLGIKDGEVTVYGILGRGEEKLLLVDTDKPPLGRLVHRPTVPAGGEPSTSQSGSERGTEDGKPPGDSGSGSGSGSRSRSGSGLGSGSGSGSGPRPAAGHADSPTLPAGATSSAEARTRSPQTTGSRRQTPVESASAAELEPHSRPKLASQTDFLPPRTFPCVAGMARVAASPSVLTGWQQIAYA